MISMVKNRAGDPDRITIKLKKHIDFNGSRPHRVDFRAIDSACKFAPCPAPFSPLRSLLFWR